MLTKIQQGLAEYVAKEKVLWLWKPPYHALDDVSFLAGDLHGGGVWWSITRKLHSALTEGAFKSLVAFEFDAFGLGLFWRPSWVGASQLTIFVTSDQHVIGRTTQLHLHKYQVKGSWGQRCRDQNGGLHYIVIDSKVSNNLSNTPFPDFGLWQSSTSKVKFRVNSKKISRCHRVDSLLPWCQWEWE